MDWTAGRAMVMGIVRRAFLKSIAWHEARRWIDAGQALRRADSGGVNLPESGYLPARESLGKQRGEAFREWSGHPPEKLAAVV